MRTRSEFDMGQVYDPAMLLDPAITDPAMMTDPAMYDPAMQIPLPPPNPIPMTTYPAAPAIPPPTPDMFDPMMPPELQIPEPEPPHTPTLMEIRRDWETMDIFEALLGEYIQLFMDRQPMDAFRPNQYRGFEAVYDSLRAIMKDNAQEDRYKELKDASAAIKAFEPTLVPYQSATQVLLDQRLPVTKRVRELRDEMSILKASITRSQSGLPVMQRYLDLYGDQVMMIQRLSSDQEELDRLLIRLQDLNSKIDVSIAKMGAYVTNFYSTHMDANQIEAGYRELTFEYAKRNPEMLMRGLQNELIDEANRRDEAIKVLVEKRRAEAEQEKQDFLVFYKTKADRYVNQNNLEQSFQINTNYVQQHSLFMIAGQEILKELKAKYEAEGAAIDREAKALEDIGVGEALFNSDEIEKRAAALQTRAKRLEYALARFKRKSEVFAEQARRVKEEMADDVERHERLKKAYDERTKYVYSEEFKRKVLAEFRGYLQWKRANAGLKEVFWINFYETGLPSQYSGNGPMGSLILRELVEYLYTNDYGKTSVEWPVARSFVDLNETPEERKIKNAKYEELIRRLPYPKPRVVPPVVKVETLLDLYLAPKEFRDKIMSNAKAFGFEPIDVKPVTWPIQLEHMKYEDKLRRVKFLMNRLEMALLDRIGVDAPDIGAMNIEEKFNFYKKAKRYLKAVAPHMPTIHLEMVKVREKIGDGSVSNTEKLAYIEALRLIRRYAYWTHVLNATAETGQQMERYEETQGNEAQAA